MDSRFRGNDKGRGENDRGGAGMTPPPRRHPRENGDPYSVLSRFDLDNF